MIILQFFGQYNQNGYSAWQIRYVLQVIAESLSDEEIAGLKEMFNTIDTDNSGQITLEELKSGLKKVGANLNDSEVSALMESVSTIFEVQLCSDIYLECLPDIFSCKICIFLFCYFL